MSDHVRKILTLVFLSVALFLLGNHVTNLTNPDEVFYAGSAKEMIEQKTWAVPYLFGQPQFEKPILIYWLIRIAFAVFGVTAFAARFFPALFALVGVLAVYFFCARVYGDRKKAFLCAFVLMSGGLYVGLARTVFTDLIFSVFIAMALGSFYLGYTDRKLKPWGLVLFFVFSALAVLTKGLLGIVMPLGAAGLFLLLRRDLKFLWCRYSFLGAVLFLLLAVPWYAFITFKFGRAFIDEFWVNDHIRRLFEAEHKGNDRWYFYPLTTLLCFFPWTIFTGASFAYLIKKLKDKSASPLYLFLACWIVAPFLLLQFAHSKLVSYIVPIFPALAIMTGDFTRELLVKADAKAKGLALASLAFILLLPLAIGVAAFRFPEYVSRPGLICAVMAVFFVIVLVQLGFVRRKARLFLYAAAFNLLFLFFTFLALNPYVDDFVASRNASEYLKQNDPGQGVVLCSKINARGVRFFSGKEVGVLSFGKGGFFSPHPIVFINTAAQLESFLEGKSAVSAVLRRKDLEAARRALDGRYDLQVLRQFGDQFVVRIIPLAAQPPVA